MTNKDSIRVGGANALDTSTGLPMFRKYTTFEANREMEYINVFYDQWLESPKGNPIEIKTGRKYIVIDQQEINHTDEGGSIVIDTPAFPMFTGWFNKIIKSEWNGARLGADVLVGAINKTLEEMPFGIGDDYKVTPN